MLPGLSWHRGIMGKNGIHNKCMVPVAVLVGVGKRGVGEKSRVFSHQHCRRFMKLSDFPHGLKQKIPHSFPKVLFKTMWKASEVFLNNHVCHARLCYSVYVFGRMHDTVVQLYGLATQDTTTGMSMGCPRS